MLVTGDQVAALREFLAGGDAAEQMYQRLAQIEGLDGYGVFVYAAFVTAVHRHFGDTWSLPEVVRLVTTVRVDLSEEGIDINAQAGENLIRRAMGDRVAVDYDEETKARAQVLLLAWLVAHERLDDAGLDAFVSQARSQADQLMS